MPILMDAETLTRMFPCRSIITQVMFLIKLRLGHIITLFQITRAMSTGTQLKKVELYIHHGILISTQIHTTAQV